MNEAYSYISFRDRVALSEQSLPSHELVGQHFSIDSQLYICRNVREVMGGSHIRHRVVFDIVEPLASNENSYKVVGSKVLEIPLNQELNAGVVLEKLSKQIKQENI